MNFHVPFYHICPPALPLASCPLPTWATCWSPGPCRWWCWWQFHSAPQISGIQWSPSENHHHQSSVGEYGKMWEALIYQSTPSFFLFHMNIAIWSFSETSSIIPVFHKERGSEKSSNISTLASEWERYDPSLVLTDKLHCLSFTSCCLIYGSNPISSLCFSQLLAFLYTSCLKADQLHSRRCQFSNMAKSKAVPGLWHWQKGIITGSNFLLIPGKKFNVIAQHLTINFLRAWQDSWHWRAAFLAPKSWLYS